MATSEVQITKTHQSETIFFGVYGYDYDLEYCFNRFVSFGRNRSTPKVISYLCRRKSHLSVTLINIDTVIAVVTNSPALSLEFSHSYCLSFISKHLNTVWKTFFGRIEMTVEIF